MDPLDSAYLARLRRLKSMTLIHALVWSLMGVFFVAAGFGKALQELASLPESPGRVLKAPGLTLFYVAPLMTALLTGFAQSARRSPAVRFHPITVAIASCLFPTVTTVVIVKRLEADMRSLPRPPRSFAAATWLAAAPILVWMAVFALSSLFAPTPAPLFLALFLVMVASRLGLAYLLRRACNDVLVASDVENMRVQHATPASGG